MTMTGKDGQIVLWTISITAADHGRQESMLKTTPSRLSVGNIILAYVPGAAKKVAP